MSAITFGGELRVGADAGPHRGATERRARRAPRSPPRSGAEHAPPGPRSRGTPGRGGSASRPGGGCARSSRPARTPPTCARSDASSTRSAGRTSSWIDTAAATWIAVGNTSLLDWPRLTWSLGCTGSREPRSPPRSSIARLAMTSLAFMFVDVPLPVWKTSTMNSSSSAPSMTSCAARMIAPARSSSSRPSSRLTIAACCLMRPMARMNPRGRRRSLIGKLTFGPHRVGAVVGADGHLELAHRVALGPGLPESRHDAASSSVQRDRHVELGAAPRLRSARPPSPPWRSATVRTI